MTFISAFKIRLGLNILEDQKKYQKPLQLEPKTQEPKLKIKLEKYYFSYKKDGNFVIFRVIDDE